jgi:predicted MPP superfamily phosphohydrolase
MSFDIIRNSFNRYNENIVDDKRKITSKEILTKGYDVLKQAFFVDERIEELGMGKRIRHHYFANFDEFYEYTKGNIYDNACYFQCDFSKIEKQIDMEKIPRNNSLIDYTIIDFVEKIIENNEDKNLRGANLYLIKEYYRGRFRVKFIWRDSHNKCLYFVTQSFTHFFDYLYFLKGDLSNADLMECDEIINLKSIEGINFSNVGIKGYICEKLGLPYEKISIPLDGQVFLKDSYDNEDEVSDKENSLVDNKRFRPTLEELMDYKGTAEENYYVTDIHILHKLYNLNVVSRVDVLYVIGKIVDNIIADIHRSVAYDNYILIGGDVSSNYEVFESFVESLGEKIKPHMNVIFILGNHELWDFPGLQLKDIVEKYRKLISDNGMYLIQNDAIFYNDKTKKIDCVYENDLTNLSIEELKQKFKYARNIILGGIGFSGYDEKFNANNGIYRYTIDRAIEINESDKFNKLYEKIKKVVPNRNVIIFTHMPMKSWREKEELKERYIYVSGHTHKNYIYLDDSVSVYANNQIGYRNNTVHLKHFLLDNSYDVFEFYEDGIYEISKDDYKDFFIARNKDINLNWDVNIIYMLKKNGYYCFIHKTKNNLLTILNGGNKKRIKNKGITYYYDNMDKVIDTIKSPLDKFNTLQEKVASEIRAIGGDGRIHGCIIDIYGYNHVYVNPNDLKVTPYYATDIINKYVYDDIPVLLEDKCPNLYKNYLKIITDKDDKGAFDIIIRSNNNLDNNQRRYTKYEDTDIYNVSRKLFSMQKLYSQILTEWIEPETNSNLIEEK